MVEYNINSDSFGASVQSVSQTDDEIELVVRLSNKASRALHYISDVRATRYDPTTKRLTLSLSDEGREVIPGTIGRLPAFRFVDPESEAEIKLRIPNRVIKLSRAAPPGELAFEKYQLSDAEEVVLDIAWADVPYYKDTREPDDKRLPAVRWQQYKARATKRLKNRKA